MQKVKIRRILKATLLIILLVSVVNGIRIYYSAQQPVNVTFDTTNDFAFSANRAQGNFVLYSEDNGIKTFPLIWGGRLFLYDVEKNKSHPIRLSAGYNGEFGNDLSLLGYNAYYSHSELTGGAGPAENLDLRSLEHKTYQGLGGDYYLINSGIIYSMDVDFGIFGAPTDTREKEYLFEGEGFYYVDCLGESLFAFNEEGNYIIEKALRGDSVERYAIPKSHFVIKIVKNEPDYFIYINKEDGTVVRYSKHDGATKTVAKFQEGVPYGEYYVCDTFKIEGDYLYINDVDFSILRVNLDDGSITKVIDQSKSSYNVESAAISYCTDYIVIDTIKTAFFGRTKTLSVYDYSGKLIRKKHLTATN